MTNMSNRNTVAKKLYEKQKGKCFYCGRKIELTYDKPNSALVQNAI